MQALAEDFFGRMLVDGILCKDGRAGESETLAVLEEVDNVFVAFAEVAAVALVKNHDDSLVFAVLYFLVVAVTGDGYIEFLNGGDDNFTAASQAFYQLVSAVGAIDGTRLKSLVFALRLRIEVMAVNNKHHLIHTIDLAHELCCLK